MAKQDGIDEDGRFERGGRLPEAGLVAVLRQFTDEGRLPRGGRIGGAGGAVVVETAFIPTDVQIAYSTNSLWREFTTETVDSGTTGPIGISSYRPGSAPNLRYDDLGAGTGSYRGTTPTNLRDWYAAGNEAAVFFTHLMYLGSGGPFIEVDVAAMVDWAALAGDQGATTAVLAGNNHIDHGTGLDYTLPARADTSHANWAGWRTAFGVMVERAADATVLCNLRMTGATTASPKYILAPLERAMVALYDEITNATNHAELPHFHLLFAQAGDPEYGTAAGEDGRFHPSSIGYYLQACVFWAVTFGEDPTGKLGYGAEDGVSYTQSLLDHLAGVAWTAAQAEPLALVGEDRGHYEVAPGALRVLSPEYTPTAAASRSYTLEREGNGATQTASSLPAVWTGLAADRYRVREDGGDWSSWKDVPAVAASPLTVAASVLFEGTSDETPTVDLAGLSLVEGDVWGLALIVRLFGAGFDDVWGASNTHLTVLPNGAETSIDVGSSFRNFSGFRWGVAGASPPASLAALGGGTFPRGIVGVAMKFSGGIGTVGAPTMNIPAGDANRVEWARQTGLAAGSLIVDFGFTDQPARTLSPAPYGWTDLNATQHGGGHIGAVGSDGVAPSRRGMFDGGQKVTENVAAARIVIPPAA